MGRRSGQGMGGLGAGTGRVFGPGDLRLILLSLIEDKPRHGYELIKALEARSDGAYSPSPGSIYPNLTLLEEQGLIRSASAEGSRKLFEITSAGADHLKAHEAALSNAMTRMEVAASAVAADAPPAAVQHAMQNLRAALLGHRDRWDEAEVERVCALIDQAAAAIAGQDD